MLARIADDQGSLVLRHGFIDVSNHELLKALVGGEPNECIQMLPIASQQTADRIAVLFGDSSLVAMGETFERAIDAIPVSQLVSFPLRQLDLRFSTHFLSGRFGKAG